MNGEVSTSLLHQVAYHMGLADVAKSLLSREGAAAVDPDVTNEFGQTALIWAARRNNLPVAAVLLSHGAEVNIADKSGSTALHHACSMRHMNMVRLLLRHGASTDVEDIDGRTPDALLATSAAGSNDGGETPQQLMGKSNAAAEAQLRQKLLKQYLEAIKEAQEYINNIDDHAQGSPMLRGKGPGTQSPHGSPMSKSPSLPALASPYSPFSNRPKSSGAARSSGSHRGTGSGYYAQGARGGGAFEADCGCSGSDLSPATYFASQPERPPSVFFGPIAQGVRDLGAGDLLIWVEHCFDCIQHSASLRHDQDRYMNVSNMILKRLLTMFVASHKQFQHVKRIFAFRIKPLAAARVGALEVQAAMLVPDPRAVEASVLAAAVAQLHHGARLAGQLRTGYKPTWKCATLFSKRVSCSWPSASDCEASFRRFLQMTSGCFYSKPTRPIGDDADTEEEEGTATTSTSRHLGLDTSEIEIASVLESWVERVTCVRRHSVASSASDSSPALAPIRASESKEQANMTLLRSFVQKDKDAPEHSASKLSRRATVGTTSKATASVLLDPKSRSFSVLTTGAPVQNAKLDQKAETCASNTSVSSSTVLQEKQPSADNEPVQPQQEAVAAKPKVVPPPPASEAPADPPPVVAPVPRYQKRVLDPDPAGFFYLTREYISGANTLFAEGSSDVTHFLAFDRWAVMQNFR